MLYLTSAFSPGMIPALQNISSEAVISLRPLGEAQARTRLQVSTFVNGIGHPATAAVVEKIIGQKLAVDSNNRPKLQLEKGDQLIVFQYFGPRLSEGAVLSQEDIEANPAWFSWMVIEVREVITRVAQETAANV